MGLAQKACLQVGQAAAFLLQGLAALGKGVPEGFPDFGGKQGAQDFPLFLGACPQKPQELPLGQDGHLGKLLAGKVQKAFRPAADSGFRAAIQQMGLPVFQGKALVALLDLRLLGAAVDFIKAAALEAVSFSSQGEVELHLGGQIHGGAHAAHTGKVPLAAGCLAVQGKAHRVQQGGFPPAGRPGDEEQPCLLKFCKIYFHPLQIRPEGLGGKTDGLHKRTSRKTSRNRAMSSCSGSSPQTSWKKAEKTVPSSAPERALARLPAAPSKAHWFRTERRFG